MILILINLICGHTSCAPSCAHALQISWPHKLTTNADFTCLSRVIMRVYTSIYAHSDSFLLRFYSIRWPNWSVSTCPEPCCCGHLVRVYSSVVYGQKK
ncbi:hypothetical protein BC826DRAFT_1026199 [Russula brevipes]|nr:hypothetical protein BC826DRAFT_1026199 [Russula brevipes]